MRFSVPGAVAHVQERDVTFDLTSPDSGVRAMPRNALRGRHSDAMAHTMTNEQAREFLGEGTRTGKVATVRVDGSPHVAPIWFVLDGEDLVFMTGAGTAKGKALIRDPRLALVVDLEEPPYGFVLVEGRASISTDRTEMLPLSIRIAQRYVAAEAAEEVGRRNAVDGELLVRLHPTKITALADMTA
jgi:PPOX class probable F420-dependent enzyme